MNIEELFVELKKWTKQSEEFYRDGNLVMAKHVLDELQDCLDDLKDNIVTKSN